MRKKGESIMRMFKILLSALFCLIFIVGCSDDAPSGGETGQNPNNPQVSNFTVTFNSQGGSSHSAVTQENGITITLPTPTRAGHWFLGWFSAASGGTKFGDGGDSYLITGNITMHAQWLQAIFFVTDDDVCADCPLPSVWYLPVRVGEVITLPRARSDSGGVFDGWHNEHFTIRYGGAGDSFTVRNGLVMYARFL
jgi:hypothetical protein